MAADDGATHRLGKFGPWPGMFVVESLDDPTTADPKLRALAPARPTFTLASAQPKSFSGFDPTTMIGAAPESNEVAGPDEAAFNAEGGRALLEGGDVASYPVSPRARAEQKARAAELGLSPGSDQLPPDVVGARDATPDAARPSALGYASAETGASPTSRRPKALDASEGTPLDPLRDKSWDLTSAKNVPAIVNPR